MTGAGGEARDLTLAAGSGVLNVRVGAIIRRGGAVLGIGNGTYLAVDLALLTQVLPQAMNRGKDLGVINVANSLPQVLAAPTAFLFVTMLGGYVSLYVLAAVIGLLGAAAVLMIKGVR